MKNIVALVITCFSLSIGLAQSGGEDNPKRVKLYLSAGLGDSYFHYNVRTFNHKIHGQSYRFDTPNFRIGLALEKRLFNNLSLKTGLRIGVRAKRAPLYEDHRPYYVYPYSFFYLDESVSKSSSSFVEIPIGLQYSKGKVRLNLGVLYRAFAIFSDGAAPDLGFLSGLSYALNDKINIGLEYFVGRRVFTRDQVHNDFGEYIYYDATDRFVQLTFEYRLKRKN